ncbi:hypothetical protein V2G26_021321 [Clonostachys chloroleuca]
MTKRHCKLPLFGKYMILVQAVYDDEYADEAALERREMVEGFREEYRAARDLEPRWRDMKCVYYRLHGGYRCCLYGVTPKCGCDKSQVGKKCKC